MRSSWLIKAGLVIILLLIIWTLYGVFISRSVPQASYEGRETQDNVVEIRAISRGDLAHSSCRGKKDEGSIVEK